MATIPVKVVTIPLLNPAEDKKVRIRTDAGIARHSVVTTTGFIHRTAIVPGVEAVSLKKAKAFDAKHPNVSGAVVWCGARNYCIYDNWSYSINCSATPGTATHEFSERRLNGVWNLVLLSRRAVAAGEGVTCSYPW
tara:strand:- start:44 stop:451 length:408 start_codon:yes stop_codon:yes gene_type:complete